MKRLIIFGIFLPIVCMTSCADIHPKKSQDSMVSEIMDTTSETQETVLEKSTEYSAKSDISKNITAPNTIKISANDSEFTAVLTDNSSSQAFVEMLENGDITIEMEDYGDFEKVGSLGTELPTNDEQTTTSAGDIILYQGNKITIYYGENSWNFTRLGKIENVTKDELIDAFGDGNVSITFSLSDFN